ncbi:MAG: DUF1211 domain-containing protein [Bacteroidetes bacterium]|nr:DUF1211 domain-containing protein [Bacteroidota bacterium]
MENNSKENLATNRIEGLSDGVFGIAMTLLIFKLDVPDGVISEGGKIFLRDKLYNMIPQFENYFVSFLLLGFYWTRHQLQFKYIKQADRNLLWINIFFLAAVGLVPFTTALLMKYTGLEMPQLLYSLNLLVIGLALAVHWSYACKNYRLVDKDLSKEYIRGTTKLIYSVPLAFGICAVVALFSPRISLTLMYVIPLIYVVARLVEKKKS